jgi:hypothetical protein
MKAEGADNAREAFQFLALALGLVLAMRLGYWALDRWMAPAADDSLGQALVPYRAGYLVDDSTLVLGARPLLERLGVAVLIAIAVAALSAVLTALVARAMGAGPVKWSARAARWSLLIVFPVLILGALAFPSRSVHIGPQGISLVHRPIPFFPFHSNTEHWNWQEIRSINMIEDLSSSELGLGFITMDESSVRLLKAVEFENDLFELADLLDAERISHQAAN